MKVITETRFVFETPDYEFVRKQLKEKKIKVKTLCNMMGISRTYYYDMVGGRRYASNKLIELFNTYGILLPIRKVSYK